MKIRVAICGLGGVADRIHLPACQAVSEIEIAAGCDPDAIARERMAAKFSLPRTYSTFEEMLTESRPEVVIIGTPPGTHFDLCRQAIESGAHVFCEKPFMPSVEEADQIISIARQRRRLLRVNNQYRFMTIYSETKQRLLRGEFGRAHYLQMWQQMYHPPSFETNWRNQLKRYVIFEFGTHALDLASYLFDSLPISVQAHTPKVSASVDADILVHLTLRFPDDRLAVFSFHRLTHAPEKYLEARLDCDAASLRLSLGGVARFGVERLRNGGFSWKYGLVRGGQARAERNGRSHVYSSAGSAEFASATAAHLRYFLEQMKSPEPPLDGAEHAREILRLVFAAYASAESGETVWLNRAQP
jgi:predicted dehydrogenase